MSEPLSQLERDHLYLALHDLAEARAIWIRSCSLVPERLAYELPVSDAAASMREYLEALGALVDREAQQ